MTEPSTSSPPADTTIGSFDLAQRAGITYRQLDYWTRVGYLHPADDDLMGSGHMREYPATELPVARRIAQLTHAGLTLKAAHSVARQLTTEDTARLGQFTVTPA